MEGKVEYISLQEATKHCNYSQEYLSLRARQGKLKAVKFGRNWVTKEDWLSEYLNNVEEYNNSNNNHKETKKEKTVLKELVQPPKNLPIEKYFKKISPAPNLKFAVSVAAVFILFFSSGVFGMSSFKNVFQELDPLVTEFSLATDYIFIESSQFYKDILKEASPLVTEFNKNFDRGASSVAKNPKIVSKEVGSLIRNLGNSISYTVYTTGLAGDIIVKEVSDSIVDSFDNVPEQVASVGDVFAEYGQWTLKKVSQLEDNLAEGYIGASDFLKDNFKNGSENTADAFTGLKNVLEDKFNAVKENYVAVNDFLERNFKKAPEKVFKGFSGLGNFLENQFNAVKDGYISANDSLERSLKKIPGKLVRGFFNISDFVKDRANRAKDGYVVANNFVETKLKQGYKAITNPFVTAYDYLTFPWRGDIPERIFVKETSKEELEAIKEEIKTLKTEGLTVKEVITEVSRIVQPVREVTKEKIVAKVDDISLALINSQISELQTEMANRLYAPGGVISQQIYVTEPVSSPKIYQENGDIVLQTAGTGNVILSAATGIQIAGKQVVIDSLSTTNPLIYIADPMNVAGDTTIESKLSVGGQLTASSIVSQGYVQTGYEGLQLTATSSAPTESLAAGRIYYDSTASNLQYYNGSIWSAIGTGSGGAFATSSDANGNLIYPQDATYDLVVGTSTGELATATAPFWIDSSTGNLTISGALTSSNVSAASTTNWDALYADGYVPASLGGTATDTTGWTGFAYVDSGTWGTSTSVEADPLWVASSTEYARYEDSSTTNWNLAYDWYSGSSTGINASSVFWDLGYFYASNYNSSSTNYDTTYDIVNASSGNWDTAYDILNASSSAWDVAEGWYTASSSEVTSSSTAWNLVADWYSASSSELASSSPIWSTVGYWYQASSTDIASSSADWEAAFQWYGSSSTGINASSTFWDLGYFYASNYNSSSTNYDTTYDIVNASSSYWDLGYFYGSNYNSSSTAYDLAWDWYNSSSTGINASSVAWDLAAGWYTASSSELLDLSASGTSYDLAYDWYNSSSTGINASSTFWDLGYFYALNYNSSSTNYDTTYDIVNASSSNWDLAYGWGDTWNIAGNIMSATDTIGVLNFGTSTATNYFTIATDTADWFVVDTAGLIGIATTSPSYGLEVHASSSAGYFGVSNILAGDMFLIDESGYVGIATTTPAASLHIYGTHATSALTVQQLGSGNIVDFMSTSTSAFTLKSDDYLKYRAGLAQTWGTINDAIIDDFEDNDVSDWTSSDTTNSSSSVTSSYFRMGDFAFSLYSASGSSAGDTATTAPATTDWSSYERLSFWIRADYTSTSTDATSTQLISVMLSDGGVTSSTTVTIAEMGKWQYQEWNISGITSANRDAVDWTGFRIDNDYGSPLFYIDQIRLYDNDLQAGEMFVDSGGNLAIWGQKTVQIGRTSADTGSLPSIEAGTAVVELNQPLSVDTGGDVGFDYDIQLLNTGLSQIISEGPLMISAGDANHYENLTLTTGGTGDIIMDIASSTIGFKIMGSATSSFGGYVFRVLPPGQVEIGNDLTISGSIFPATTTATSSEWSLGTSTAYWENLYVVNEYVGDVIFANQFRITEAADDAVPQGLYFQNASSSNILFIDENGNLTTETLIAKKAHLEKLEMVDQVTGELWCVWIENGEWVKTSGQCDEAIVEPASIETVEIIDIVDSTSSTSSISAPDTVITSQPPTETLSVEATIEFVSTKENSTFQCKINDLNWENCSSPKKYSGLVPGDYVFQVMATDEQGVYDTTPAVANWTILSEGNEEIIIPPEEPPATTTEPIVPEEPPATTTEPLIPEEPAATTTEPIVPEEPAATTTETTATSTEPVSTTTTP